VGVLKQGVLLPPFGCRSQNPLPIYGHSSHAYARIPFLCSASISPCSRKADLLMRTTLRHGLPGYPLPHMPASFSGGTPARYPGSK